MYNEQFRLEVSENWEISRKDRICKSKNWRDQLWKWWPIKWNYSKNHNYPIVNITNDWKRSSISKHRIVFATYNNLDYYWDYIVWHYDDDPTNNHIDNLYMIQWKHNTQENIDHKKKAYKLLALCKQWKVYNSDGVIIDYETI